MESEYNQILVNLNVAFQSNVGVVLSEELVHSWTEKLEHLSEIHHKNEPNKAIHFDMGVPRPKGSKEAPARGAAAPQDSGNIEKLVVKLDNMEVNTSKEQITPRTFTNVLAESEDSPHPGNIDQDMLPPPPPANPNLVSTVSFAAAYEVKEEIEQFTNGNKYLVIDKETEQEVVARVYNFTDEVSRQALEPVRKEADLLRTFQNPNVVRCLEFFENPETQQITLVTEKLSGSVVRTLCTETGDKLTERQARDLIRGMISGLAYLHGQGVVHRHLHPDTVCTGPSGRPEDVRLAGFGFAEEIENLANCTEKVGTLMFAAPEMLVGKPYNEKVDIWSAGVMSFLLLGGYPPFYAKESTELQHRVRTGQFRFHSQFWNHISSDAKDLIQKMLKVNPTQRSSAKQLLQHPWLKTPGHVLAAHDLTKNRKQLQKFHAKLLQSDSHHAPHDHHLEFEDVYDKGEKLGEGAFGQVFVCIDKRSGDRHAVKCMDRSTMSPDDVEGLEMEIAVMKELEHPNIVRLLNTFVYGPTTYMVLELATGGELFDRIVSKEHYCEAEARGLIHTVLKTLHFLHSSDIVHRDLKPENLLLTSDADDADIKVADFGFAVHISALKKIGYDICGTPDYMAPELHSSKPYNEKVDIWSFGVICYVLLGGYMPFHGETEEELFHRIKCGHFRFHPDHWEDVSEGAKDFISCMLLVNPTKRWSAKHLLAHPWMNIEDTDLGSKNLSVVLNKFQDVKKKFKKGVKAVIASHVFSEGSPQQKLGKKVSGKQYQRTHFQDVYEQKDELGRGAFGTVYLALNKQSGFSYAAKRMDRSKMGQEDLEGLEMEIAVMKELRHPHVVRLVNCFVELELTYLVLELVSGGELFDRIVKKSHYNEKEARVLVRTFLETLTFLHHHDICHRDLKPENLLLASEDDDTDIKIADFGFATHISDLGDNPEACGSPLYLSPEMIKGQKYNEKVDVWSAGVIIYVLLVGYPPFYAEDQQELFNNIKKGKFHFYPQEWSTISNEAKKLIKRMLVVNPHQRASAEELLREPWLQLSEQRLERSDLTNNLENLRRFNAKRKLKGAIDAVVATGKMRNLMEKLHSAK